MIATASQPHIRTIADERAADAGYWFDSTAADHAVGFIERFCHHSIGRWRGQPFKLMDWQRDEIVRPLFGWKDRDGLRRFRRAGIWVPKKNGKSTLCAAIELYLLVGDNEGGAQVYIAAADRNQASIVYRESAAMVQSSPQLKSVLRINNSTHVISFPANDGFIRVLSADSFRQEGLNIHGLIFDELHAQKTRALFDCLKFGGVSRRQPVLVTISTAGFDRGSIGYEEYQYAKSVIDGTNKDDRFLAVVYGAEKDDDWTRPDVWRMANPSIDTLNGGLGTVVESELAEACVEAENSADRENVFRRYRLNQWVSQEFRYFSMRDYDACTDVVSLEELRGRKCYAGLDLATTYDMSSFAMVFPLEDGRFAVHWLYWLPRETATADALKHNIPFAAWERDGHITLTPGRTADFAAIRDDILACAKAYSIEMVGYDRHMATETAAILESCGLRMVEIPQTCIQMHEPTERLAALVVDHKLVHNGNPVSWWCADNMHVRKNWAGNVIPTKMREHERIDGMVAAIMGIKLATIEAPVSNVLVDMGMQVW